MKNLIETVYKIALLATALLIHTSIHAKLANDTCSAILAGGVFDKVDLNIKNDHYALAKSWACEHSYEEFNTARRKSASGSYGPYSADYNDDRSSYRQWKEENCSYEENPYKEDSFRYHATSHSASSQILSAWKECMVSHKEKLLLYGSNLVRGNDYYSVNLDWRGRESSIKFEMVNLKSLFKLPTRITVNDSHEYLPFQVLDASQPAFLKVTVTERSQDTASETLTFQKLKPLKYNGTEICSCTGHGGVEGVTMWGPKGKPCAGFKEWGNYQNSCRPSSQEICMCTGHGGVKGLEMWGPKGEHCGGFGLWGTFSRNCQKRSNIKLSRCHGYGGVLGVNFWGPKDFPCMGLPEWGDYNTERVH